MIIRSQDKKSITTDLNLQIYDCTDGGYEIVNGTVNTLGKYSTKEKAIKVLDMIANTYVETVWTDREMIIANRVCFDMPQDSEV